MTRRAAMPCLFAALAWSSSCAELTDAERFPATNHTLRIVSTSPAQGATGVDPDAPIDFCFSGAIDPSAIDSFDAVLSSGLITFDVETEVQLFAWREPGSGRELATHDWCPGSVLSVTPKATLDEGVLHRVRLHPTAAGWGGESLDTSTEGWVVQDDGDFEFQLEFVPGPHEESLEPEFAGLTLTELFEEGEALDPAGTNCSCHTGEVDLATERLDLRNVDAAYEGLVLREGKESTGSPMVSPRLPAKSYLVQKLTRAENGLALHRVHGDPMPGEGSVSAHDRAAIAAWIHEGAAR